MTNAEYIGIVKDGAFVALSPESVAGTRLRLTRAAMQASFPPEHEELDPTICEGKAIMIRGHGDGEWIWSTEVVDVAGPILTETVRKLFAVTVTQPVTAGSALGTNLTNISDWSREWCFVDAFKASRAWISGSVDGTWDDGRALDLDEDGWVRSLLEGQIARTLLLSDPAGHYPAGRYIVLYEGEGTIEYRDAAQKDIAASGQGRDVIEVDPSRGGAIRIQIAAIDESDYLRNIRVIMPGGVCADDPFQWCRDYDDCSSGCISFEGDEQQIFHPTFLSRIRNYGVLRFMNWMATTDSEQSEWRNRPGMSDARWSTKGVPVEVMVELANRMKADPWFCMPHLATDEYITEFARLVYASLDTERTIYVEHSNEVWNGIFAQARYASEQGMALGLSENDSEARLYYHARRSVEIFRIWQTVFGSQSERVVRVMGSQAANTWASRQVLSYNDASEETDALAIAPYFGGYLGGPEQQERVQAMNLDDLFDELETVALPETIQWIQNQAEVASEYGVDLIAYEGGQHLVALPGVWDNSTINQLFDDVNRDERMGPLYSSLLAAWRNCGGRLFVHFNNCRTYDKFGRWGALEYLEQERSDAPKFDALQTFIAENPIWW